MVNTSIHITKTSRHHKTHTYTHPHITVQVKTNQMGQSQYNQVPSA